MTSAVRFPNWSSLRIDVSLGSVVRDDSGPGFGVKLTAQGHPRAIFRRAIERRNLLIAEATARELGALDLAEALDLVCLVAEKHPARLDTFARRWLARLAVEKALRLPELDIAITALRRSLGTSCRCSACAPMSGAVSPGKGRALAMTRQRVQRERHALSLQFLVRSIEEIQVVLPRGVSTGFDSVQGLACDWNCRRTHSQSIGGESWQVSRIGDTDR